MSRLARAVAAVSAVAALLAPGAAAQRAPSLNAGSAILVDARNGDVLLARNPDDRRSIASTTKLMTALLALERSDPGDVFVAPSYNALPAESKINLRRGERMKVSDLLEALLLESANDAAVTLAEGVAGSRSGFVGEMNRRAVALGLRDTSYANPIGLDDPDNYSTARDLSRLTIRLLRNRRFARIVDMPRAVLASGSHRRVVANRNRLVREVPIVSGVKTGHTIRARYVLIGSAEAEGARVVSVVLGEPSEAARDTDSLALLRYGLAQFRRVAAVQRGRTLARADIKYRDERVRLVAARPVRLTVRRGERPRTRVDAPEELEGPLARGERVGTVSVAYRGRVVRRVPLVTAKAVPEAGFFRRVTSLLGVPLTLLLFLAIVSAAVWAVRRTRAEGEGTRTARETT